MTDVDANASQFSSTSLAQIEYFVGLLGAPGQQQLEWLSAGGFPNHELLESFLDRWPFWRDGLKAEGLLAADLETALDNLAAVLTQLNEPGPMWENNADSLSEPGWSDIRNAALAASALFPPDMASD